MKYNAKEVLNTVLKGENKCLLKVYLLDVKGEVIVTEAEEIMKRFDELDLYSKTVVAQCIRRIKPISIECIERTRKDIYYLSPQRLNIVDKIIDIIESFNRIGGLKGEEHKKLLEYAELAEYFHLD